MTSPPRDRVRILRVLGIRSSTPQVLAGVGDHLVTWDPRGWECTCPDPECGHVDAVADLLDPRVTIRPTSPQTSPGDLEARTT